jgi:hypothetical protein
MVHAVALPEPIRSIGFGSITNSLEEAERHYISIRARAQARAWSQALKSKI